MFYLSGFVAESSPGEQECTAALPIPKVGRGACACVGVCTAKETHSAVQTGQTSLPTRRRVSGANTGRFSGFVSPALTGARCDASSLSRLERHIITSAEPGSAHRRHAANVVGAATRSQSGFGVTQLDAARNRAAKTRGRVCCVSDRPRP